MNEVIELQSQDVPEDTTYMYDHQTDEAFFPVASTPVLDEDGQPTGYQRIKRTDTDKTLAIPKMVYTLIPYQKKVDILKETVRNSESIDITDMTETIRTSHEGRRLFVGINLPAEHQRIGYKDDGVNLSINLWDSYDRSCSLIVKAGCYRAKCSNGMLIGETISGIHKRHTGEFDEEKLREEIFAGTLTAIDAWKMERATLSYGTTPQYLKVSLTNPCSNSPINKQLKIVSLHSSVKNRTIAMRQSGTL